MKRKGLVVVMCVLLLGAFTVSGALATQSVPGWVTCTVQWAGTSGAVYFCQLTSTDGTTIPTPTYFFLDTSQGTQNEMLACLLTAWSSGGDVQVYLNINTQYATIIAVAATTS